MIEARRPLMELRADPADEPRLVRAGPLGEHQRGPQLGRTSGELAERYEDDIAGRHGFAPGLMSASEYSGSSGP